ncbi:cell division cycle protein 27 homolog [Agrilus planipennis]|uniref:Cell division cycle protein 27 homolog n=1 Tax=Agrilus planipennis TaxID=224129 RepID=A0A1W4WJJ2_AGRPL|nr:cell division cycle protein 27 homolog [Agrilus planipennis]
MILQEPIQATVWHCLNHYQFSDAVFLSERLHAEVETDDSLFLLATAYYRSGQIDHAYHILKDRCNSSPHCRYLFGKCAFQKEKYAEVESVILDSFSTKCKTLEDIVIEFGDQAAFVLILLAKTAIKTEKRAKAAEALKLALKLNPFLWSCFSELCNLGEKPNASEIFKLTGLENLSTCYGSHMKNFETFVHTANTPCQEITYATPPQQIFNTVNNVPPNISNNTKLLSPEESPLANPLIMSGCNFLPVTRAKPLKYRLLNSSLASSPSFGMLPLDSPEVILGTPLVSQATLTESNDQHKSLAKKVRAHMGQLINRKETPLQNNKPVFSQSSNTNTISVTPSTPASVNNLQPIQNVRRSSRLFSNCSVKENNKSPNRSKFATPRSPTKKTKQRIAKCNLNKTSTFAENTKNRLEKEKSETITSNNNYSAILGQNHQSNTNCTQQITAIQKQSAEGLMNLLRQLGKAHLDLSLFNCKNAIEELLSLPPNQFETTWVYGMLGLAYFEMADYENSVKYFGEIRNREPHSFQFMDVYSTALWHLQKEVALSALAQDLVSINKNSPITWCVNGNCFSLHKEHDTAIKFFQRAVQVEPAFAYAYTLLGHEYIMTDELDKAMSCFRNAIRINPRHYNAWFGIGTIYSKQERYHLAEVNYLGALAINPNSSVLMCHLGIVQNALKKTDKALNTLNLAINKDPKNPLCKFHRGSIYFSIGRYAEALKELEELKEIVPKESLVYYLTGKVHKKLGNTDLALMHFSWATDLDPKGANSQIKEAFDPSFGRSTTEMESPASPTREESNSGEQQLQFFELPEESDDSL